MRKRLIELSRQYAGASAITRLRTAKSRQFVLINTDAPGFTRDHHTGISSSTSIKPSLAFKRALPGQAKRMKLNQKLLLDELNHKS